MFDLAKFEVVDGLRSKMLRMGEFENCDDPREYVRLSNRLFDACVEAGMCFDEPDHEAWADDYVLTALLN